MRVPVLLLLGVLLAGCSDGGPAEPAGDVDGLSSTPSRGLIRGVVLDETINPVADARVLLDQNETTTDAEGRFGFGDLEPGTHLLDVRKPGHADVQVSATVVAGVDRPDVVRVSLPRLPETLPYVVATQVTGRIACEAMVGVLMESCDRGTGLAGSSQSRLFVPVDARAPHAVQVEVEWSATQATGSSMTLTFGACRDGDYCSPYEFGVNTLCQTWGPSVLWCRSDQDSVERSGGGVGGDPVGQTALGTGDGPGIAVALGADCAVCTPPGTPQCDDACGVGLVVEQEFDVYVHVFYNFLPDEGWVFVQDGAHPVPER